MNNNPPSPPDTFSLRAKAEERLKLRSSETNNARSKYDLLRTVHELEVHQIELEMQNEQLQEANDKSELDKKTIELLLHQSRMIEKVLKENEILLNSYNDILAGRVESGLVEIIRLDKLLISHSRQAAMGEMLSCIAHQWRQPLNILSLKLQRLQMIYGMERFGKEFLDNSVDSSMKVIKHMSKTITDFSNFFKPDKEIALFKINDVVNSTISLVKDSLDSNKISLNISTHGVQSTNGFPNEYAQVLLNIIMNAQDALLDHEVNNPHIEVSSFVVDDKAVVTISDNAGGVPEEILNRIFDPYFTTKAVDRGTGIGLFMSKTIIENNMNGKLSVRNINGGAEFRIEV
jgi:signal transduction histidine kinase